MDWRHLRCLNSCPNFAGLFFSVVIPIFSFLFSSALSRGGRRRNGAPFRVFLPPLLQRLCRPPDWDKGFDMSLENDAKSIRSPGTIISWPHPASGQYMSWVPQRRNNFPRKCHGRPCSLKKQINATPGLYSGKWSSHPRMLGRDPLSSATAACRLGRMQLLYRNTKRSKPLTLARCLALLSSVPLDARGW